MLAIMLEASGHAVLVEHSRPADLHQSPLLPICDYQTLLTIVFCLKDKNATLIIEFR